VITTGVNHDLRKVSVFFFREDDTGGDRAVVQESREFREPPVDELPQWKRDFHMPASDVESHDCLGSQLPASSSRR
jgi:hypothetical protein